MVDGKEGFKGEPAVDDTPKAASVVVEVKLGEKAALGIGP
jgi:hypothetical protein